MIPSTFVSLDALPLTPNGKIDRRALLLPPVTSEPEDCFVAPRDELEAQLAKIWERVLGCGSIGVRDDFFDLGGHSLLAVRVCRQVEKTLGKKIPVATLFWSPTVEQLAEILREEGWSSAGTALVPLQTNGSKPPFFFLAGRNHFGDRLGPEQPVYRVVYQDLDREQPLVRIEDMATHSINGVRTIQPEGRYYLGGHGLGGVVAFEMAQQLQQQGEKVALLAVCETQLPGSSYALPDTSSVYRLWQRIHYYFHRARRIGARQQLAGLLRSVKKKTQRAAAHRSGVSRTRSRQGYRGAAHDALKQYVPQAYTGRVTVVRGTERVPWRHHDPLNGWGSLATEVDAYEIPGTHTSIYTEPNVEVLASTLNDVLHKAQAGAEDEPTVLVDRSVSAEPIPSDDTDNLQKIALSASS